MIAVNHALTGALIGLSMTVPVIALPAALLSHFVCDALPHYGRGGETNANIRSTSFTRNLCLDAGLCVLLVVALALLQPQAWLLAAGCAFLATSPDFAWLPGYVRSRRGQDFALPNQNRFMRFASQLQWFERPIGGLVEIAWASAGVVLLVAYL